MQIKIETRIKELQNQQLQAREEMDTLAAQAQHIQNQTRRVHDDLTGLARAIKEFRQISSNSQPPARSSGKTGD